MPESAKEMDGAGLSVIVAESGHRFVIDARWVEKLVPIGPGGLGSGDADDEVPVVRLASRLKIDPPAEARVLVFLRERRVQLAVQAIEAVVDLGDHRLISLPVLTRLQRPVFRGVHELKGELLPAIDLDGLLGEDRE